MLSLSNIKAKKGQKKPKRVGRGLGSGHGCYSTRGCKGQKSRSGVSGLKRLGMRPRILQAPKVKGFHSLSAKNQPVSIVDINKNFKDGALISPQTLFAAGLIKKLNQPVKILGKDKLEIKVKFEGVKLNKGLEGIFEKK